ncbi:MAG: TetR/AcrR family transcriptional regulator [Pseudomonadota bacterium]
MERSPRRDKYAERRAELGEAALQTLAELGYARTSLREIAQNSAFSHGVLHYYFTDKLDLILCSVRQYKARCVTRYDEVTSTSTTFAELVDGFVRVLGETVRTEPTMHRLWYDIRSQSLFEDALRADVQAIDTSLANMVWRVLTRMSELAGLPVRAPIDLTYAMFDGVFQQCLLRHMAGDAKAIPVMQGHVRLLVEQLIGPTALAAAPAKAMRKRKPAALAA